MNFSQAIGRKQPKTAEVRLAGTELAKAQCDTVRLKLLKIGALVRITVRKIWISWSAGYPYAELFGQVYRQLQQAPLRC